MTVWVVHGHGARAAGEHNLTPAARFGELRYINQYYVHGDELQATDRSVSGTDQSYWTIPAGYRLNMERAVVQFDPDNDYLLIYGDHLQLLALTLMLAAKFHSISVLRWDRKLNDYIPVRLHSGLVPPGAPVLTSTPHIGETEHAESRNQGRITPLRQGVDLHGREISAVDIEAPLARRNPRTRDPS